MNIKQCKKCGGSGNNVGWAGPIKYSTTGTKGGSVLIKCKYCDGKGYYDEEELITVQRKYVKDEYFNDLQTLL